MPNLVPFYRLFHYGGGKDHFYTTNKLVAEQVERQQDWAYEGILGSVWDGPAPNTTPFYVVYHNSQPGEHFYTTDVVERDRALEHGYIVETSRGEIACWIYPRQFEPSQQPIYRMFDPQDNGGHFYTMDWNETLRATSQEFKQEGVAGYCYPYAGPSPRP